MNEMLVFLIRTGRIIIHFLLCIIYTHELARRASVNDQSLSAQTVRERIEGGRSNN